MSEFKSVTLLETVLTHVATIAAAYMSHNSVAVNEIPNLVQTIHAALTGLEDFEEATVEATPEPAVPAKKSVYPDYIVCLEDGKKFKTLKRHLKTTYNMTPSEYRNKWNLPHSYPMTAPSYSAKRSGLAKESGLGQRD